MGQCEAVQDRSRCNTYQRVHHRIEEVKALSSLYSLHSMSLPRYEYRGPIDHTVKPASEHAKGKSVIVTGGANGIGESCVRLFVTAGAFVTFADLSDRGREIESELNLNGSCCAFVRCDIRSWEDQKTLFSTAKAVSPSQSVDIVIANAGISRSSGDSLWKLDGILPNIVEVET